MTNKNREFSRWSFNYKSILFALIITLIFWIFLYEKRETVSLLDFLDTNIEQVLYTQNSNNHQIDQIIDKSSEILRNRSFITVNGDEQVAKTAYNELYEILALQHNTRVYKGMSQLLSPLSKWAEDMFFITMPKWLVSEYSNWQGNNHQDLVNFEDWFAEERLADINSFLLTEKGMSLYPLLAFDPWLLHIEITNSLEGMLPDINQNGNLIIVDSKPSAGFETLSNTRKTIIEFENKFPSINFHYTGHPKYAEYSKNKISKEVTWINIISFILVTGAILFFFKRLQYFGVILTVLLISVFFACAFVIFKFGQIHVLTIAIGSLINGIAVDYAFHIYLRGDLTNRSFLKPLLQGFISTLIAFFSLVFTGFTLFEQLAYFVTIGLSMSLLLFMATDIRSHGLDSLKKILPHNKNTHKTGRLKQTVTTILILACVALISITALFPTRWKDDVRSFNIDLTSLTKLENKDSEDFTKAHIYRVKENHKNKSNTDLSEIGFSIHSYLLTDKEEETFYKLVNEDSNLLNNFMNALDGNDYDLSYFDQFTRMYNSINKNISELPINDLILKQAKLFGDRILEKLAIPAYSEDSMIYITRSPLELDNISSLESLNPLDKINAQVKVLRLKMIELCLILGIIITILIIIFNKIELGINIILIPVISILFFLAVSSLLRIELNLFHCVGLLLGSFIAIDYALFSLINNQTKNIPYSVKASSVTSILAFACLLLSSVPVVFSLGISALIVIISSISVIYIILKSNQNS